MTDDKRETNVSDAEVEAAARAMHYARRGYVTTWEEEPDHQRKAYIGQARHALAAVVPLLSADEVEAVVDGLTMEHFDDVEVHHGRCVLVSDMPRIVDRLRERLAQEVEAAAHRDEQALKSALANDVLRGRVAAFVEAARIVRGGGL